jgi:hypothetical protein
MHVLPGAYQRARQGEVNVATWPLPQATSTCSQSKKAGGEWYDCKQGEDWIHLLVQPLSHELRQLHSDYT